MKKVILCLVWVLFYSVTFTQDAKVLVSEGVALHDKGLYDEALKKYDAALETDPNNYLAYYEKSYTLLAIKKYDDCISLCKFLLKNFKDGPENASVYINYGTCLDFMGKAGQAVEVYDEGIHSFPDVGLLYFNKAITLFTAGKTGEALDACKLSILKSPYHASSHNMLSMVMNKKNRIYSLMASLVFLAIEPDGNRAKNQLNNVQSILAGNTKKTGDNSVTVNVDRSMLTDKKGAEDDFHSIDLITSITAGLDFDEKYKNETPVERTERKLESIFAIISETEENKKGFSWTYYAPFFVSLKKLNYLNTFTHILYSSANDGGNNAWLQDHRDKVDEFNAWFREYWRKR